jgi:hypothetical protein
MYFNQLVLGGLYYYCCPGGTKFPGKIIQVGSSHGFKTKNALYVLSPEENELICVEPSTVKYNLQLDRFESFNQINLFASHS